jgi:thymidine kinase
MIAEYVQAHGRVDCILVDEAQFFMPSQIDDFFWIAVEQNIPVICYGLRTDFLLQSFP